MGQLNVLLTILKAKNDFLRQFGAYEGSFKWTKFGSTGDLALSRGLRTENDDFGASKMKSRYGHKIITRVFLG